MHVIEIPNYASGAAYQIMFEIAMPQNCATRERKAEIDVEFKRVIKWAAQQSPQVLNAYVWAAKAILDEIDRSIARNDMHMGVQGLLKSFPRPPVATFESDADFRTRITMDPNIVQPEDVWTATGARLDEIGAACGLKRKVALVEEPQVAALRSMLTSTESQYGDKPRFNRKALAL